MRTVNYTHGMGMEDAELIAFPGAPYIQTVNDDDTTNDEKFYVVVKEDEPIILWYEGEQTENTFNFIAINDMIRMTIKNGTFDEFESIITTNHLGKTTWLTRKPAGLSFYMTKDIVK